MNAKLSLSLIAAFVLCVLPCSAKADTAFFQLNGGFEFNSMSITAETFGTCSNGCPPWGDSAYMSLSFSAAVTDYQETTTCYVDYCDTFRNGNIGAGTLTGSLFDGTNNYNFSPDSFSGSFNSWQCTGNCGSSPTANGELDFTFDGSWSNGWHSSGNVEFGCSLNGDGYGCPQASGWDYLTTETTPEPGTLLLLVAGASGMVYRRLRLFKKV